MRHTLALIGRAIKTGSTYLPLRNYAAALATRAAPKDYFGQAKAIYDDITQKRWKYVKDPWRKELLTFGPQQLWTLVLAGDGVGVGLGRGAGDCDCISAANGAMLQAIGLKVRLATTSPVGSLPGPTFAHVFVQCFIPGFGWITSDPVVWPEHGFGYTTPHSRIAYYDLDGHVVGTQGNVVNLTGINKEVPTMSQYGNRLGSLPDLTQWQDYGFAGVDDARVKIPDDWRTVGLPQFGIFAEYEGILSGEGLNLHVEATPELVEGQVVARTPLLELAPDDYFHMRVVKRPYPGMLGLGDDGQVYYYDGTLGFFKKLFRRVAKGVKKVAGRIKKGVKKVISKIPGGKYLIKLGGKLFKIAAKLVKPLMKWVGPLATKLAPVAALIPGYGPAIAAGLYGVGKIAAIMKKTGAVIKTVKGVARLKFPSGSAAKKMQSLLSVAAKQEQKRQAAGGKIPKIGVKRKKIHAKAMKVHAMAMRRLRAIKAKRRSPGYRRV